MEYHDLRDWMEHVDDFGELRRIHGAHWDLEIGAITEVGARDFDSRLALMFDDIPGYPSGYRVLTNPFGTVRRLALTVGFPIDLDKLAFVQRWRKFEKGLKPVPPVEVDRGPVLQNVQRAGEIDMLQFPVPRWHELDGGRFIGTGDCIITRDPDSGWENIGTYRVQVIDRDQVSIFMGGGRHGHIHMKKFHERGEPCPVVMVFGGDPLLYLTSTLQVPPGVSEYAYAAAIRGRPYETFRGPHTGLSIPVDAEIAVEGDIIAGENVLEGPFGEFTGYYGGAEQLEPLIRVQNLFYRDAPIIGGASPARSPTGTTLQIILMRAGVLWNQLEAVGVPDVCGVWLHYPGYNYFAVVSIKQRYAGHAKQAAIVASQCRAIAAYGKWVVVVDDDIDPTNINDVLWAISTRCDPERDIEVVRDTWSNRLDPMAHDDLSSKVIVNACKPYNRLNNFPKTAEVSRELREKTLAKWGAVLGGEVSPTIAQARR